MNFSNLFFIFVYASALFCFPQISWGTSNSAEIPLEIVTTTEKNPISSSLFQVEIYSETTSRPQFQTIVNQSRVRAGLPIDLTNQVKLSMYAGVAFDREFGSPDLQWIQDSWQPQIGLSTKPFEFMQIWAEYNRRYFKTDNKNDSYSEENDFRAGLAAGYDYKFENNSLALATPAVENYFEAVSYFRAANQPVTAAHTRALLQWELQNSIYLAPYSELYFQRSPVQDLGMNTNQARGGLRLKYQSESYSAALYGYWPKEIGATKDFDGYFVGLFVFGGYF